MFYLSKELNIYNKSMVDKINNENNIFLNLKKLILINIFLILTYILKKEIKLKKL